MVRHKDTISLLHKDGAGAKITLMDVDKARVFQCETHVKDFREHEVEIPGLDNVEGVGEEEELTRMDLAILMVLSYETLQMAPVSMKASFGTGLQTLLG